MLLWSGQVISTLGSLIGGQVQKRFSFGQAIIFLMWVYAALFPLYALVPAYMLLGVVFALMYMTGRFRPLLSLRRGTSCSPSSRLSTDMCVKLGHWCRGRAPDCGVIGNVCRRVRASNPRYGFKPHNALAGRPLRPLGHLYEVRDFILDLSATRSIGSSPHSPRCRRTP
jgi:hypothetical protein